MYIFILQYLRHILFNNRWCREQNISSSYFEDIYALLPTRRNCILNRTASMDFALNFSIIFCWISAHRCVIQEHHLFNACPTPNKNHEMIQHSSLGTTDDLQYKILSKLYNNLPLYWVDCFIQMYSKVIQNYGLFWAFIYIRIHWNSKRRKQMLVHLDT